MNILQHGVSLNEKFLTPRLTLKPTLEQNLPEYARDKNMNYTCLFYDNIQVSDNIFRVGGFGGTFTDGYCTLINYIPDTYSESVVPKASKEDNRYLASHWCIINEKGKVMVQVEDSMNYIHHIGGVLCRVDNRGIVNIETNEVILDRYAKVLSTTKDYSFINGGYSDEHESGVYKIEKATGDYEFFPNK